MTKRILMACAVILLFWGGCTKEDDAIYYPLGDVDIENGEDAWEVTSGFPIARSYNEEDFVLDTVAIYPDDPTVGKLTFMFDLKNRFSDNELEGFNGVGRPKLTMSVGYKDGSYSEESQVPIYISPNANSQYAVKLRLKGEIETMGEGWMIDYAYVRLSSLFHAYPPENFPAEVFMCKGGMKLGMFDSMRRTCEFDITYDRSGLSFDKLYFNLFVNLAGQERDCRVRLKIGRESYFEIYRQEE